MIRRLTPRICLLCRSSLTRMIVRFTMPLSRDLVGGPEIDHLRGTIPGMVNWHAARVGNEFLKGLREFLGNDKNIKELMKQQRDICRAIRDFANLKNA